MATNHLDAPVNRTLDKSVQSLEQAKAFLESGREDKARDAVLKCLGSAPKDASTCLGLAEICEELGMARHAREFYEQALKLSPGDGEILYRLASLLADVGDYEKSLHHLKKAVRHDPNHEAARKLLAENYRALGLSGLAESLAPGPEIDKADSPLRSFPPSIGRRDTENFLALFSGREVGHGIQQVGPRAGELACVHREGPLTAELVASHLLGEATLAVYPLRSDNTVRFAAVSVRLPSFILEANLKNRGYLILLQEKVKLHGLTLARLAERLGLPAYPEENGDGTFRLWFFFETFTHFLKAKQFVAGLIRNGPRPEGHLVVEPVLATRPAGLGWTESPVVLPLGIHRGTLRRSLFLDDEGRPHGEQLKFLRRIRRFIPRKAIEALSSASGAAPFPPGRGKDLPAFMERLARRCPVVRELVRMAVAGKQLRREEKVILYYSVGLADPDGDVLHRLLSGCPDYDYQGVKRQLARLKSHPVSCPKIREMVPEITISVGCDCALDLRGGKYPSPLLHINPNLVPAAEDFLTPADLPMKEAARRYVNLRERRLELEKAISRCETVLEKHFAKKGIDRVKLENSLLRRVDENGVITWRTERD